MNELRTFAALVLVLASASLVVTNWAGMVVNLKNHGRLLDRHHSMISLMAIGMAGLAYFCAPGRDAVWVFLVPLLDLMSWCLFWLPFFLLLIFFNDQRNKPDE